MSTRKENPYFQFNFYILDLCIIGLFSFFISIPAFSAQEDDRKGTEPSLKEAIEALGEGMREIGHALLEVEKSIIETQKDMLDTSKEIVSEINSSTSNFKVFPEDQLVRNSRSLEVATSGQLKKIIIDNDIKIESPEIVLSNSQDSSQLSVEVTVMTDPNHLQKIEPMLNAIKMNIDDGILNIKEVSSSRICVKYNRNGALSIGGSCYTSLVLTLPSTLQDTPIFYGNKQISGQKEQMTFNTLMQLLEETRMNSEKTELVLQFAQDTPSSTSLSRQEIGEILEEISMDSNRLQAFKSLTPFIKCSEKDSYIDFIEEEFSFSSTRSEAHRALLGASCH